VAVFGTHAEIDRLLRVPIPALGDGFGLESGLPAQSQAQHINKGDINAIRLVLSYSSKSGSERGR